VADDGAHPLWLRIPGGRDGEVIAPVHCSAEHRIGDRGHRRVVDL
jgi:hypothetical protein